MVDLSPAWSQGDTDLDFANARFWQADVEYASYAAWAATVTLSITGDVNRTYFDASGVMQNSLLDAPRFDHNPATLAKYGSQSEGPRTNLKVRSQEPQNGTFYNRVRLDIDDNAIVAPDGTTTAGALTEQAVTNTFHIDSSAITISTGAAYTFSAFVKKLGRRYITLDAANVAARACFDLDNGVVQATEGAEFVSAGIVPVGNGWFRVWVTFNESASASVSPRIWVNDLATDFISGTHVGDIAKGVYTWGWQLELGAFPSSYIRTAASISVARAADIRTETVAHEATGSIRRYFRTPSGKEGNQVLWQRDDTSEDNRFRCFRDSAGDLHWIVTEAGVDEVDLNLGAVADLTVGYTDFSWAAGDYSASLNGGTAETSAYATVPAGLTTIRSGHNVAGTSNWFGHLPREVQGVTEPGEAPFSVTFGVITDLHASLVKPNHDGLNLEDGIAKLTAAVAYFNGRSDITRVFFCGDLIETYGASFTVADAQADLTAAVAVLNTLTKPWHFVPGNHDFDKLSRAQFEAILGRSSGYHSFDADGLHHVINDGCYDEDDDASIYTGGNFDTNGTDAYIAPTQRAWMEADLAATSLPSIIWVHQRLDTGTGGHLSNKEAVRTIIEAAPKGVTAIQQGHHHTNALVYVNGNPYVTNKDQATDALGVLTLGVHTVTDDHYIVTGSGNQTSRSLVRQH